MVLSTDELSKVWNCFTQMQDYVKFNRILITSGKECYLYDHKDRKLFDASSSLLNSCVGHGNAEIVEQMKEQALVLDNTSLFISSHSAAINLSNVLSALTDNRFEHYFFCNSGSESVETAIKIGAQYFHNTLSTNDVNIVVFKGCYHGSSLVTNYLETSKVRGLELSINVHWITPPVTDEEVPMSLDALREIANNGNPTVLLTEIIQLSNACCTIHQDFFSGIDEFRNHDFLWIVDEVATGFFRTGTAFAYQSLNCTPPDIITIGKGLTGGYFPMGAACITKQIFEAFLGDTQEDIALMNGFTTSGHPIGCGAALGVMNYVKKYNVAENATKSGKHLLDGLTELAESSSIISQIRGKGMMYAILLKEEFYRPGEYYEKWGLAQLMIHSLVRYGVLAYPDSDTTIIIAPPLVSSTEEIDFLLKKLRKVFTTYEKVVAKRKV